MHFTWFFLQLSYVLNLFGFSAIMLKTYYFLVLLFMFQSLQLMFQVLKHMFQTLKHMFQSLKYKIIFVQQTNSNSFNKIAEVSSSLKALRGGVGEEDYYEPLK